MAEQEAAWLRDGGITDETWAAYKENLNSYGMDKLLEAYQSAYDRYAETAGAQESAAPAAPATAESRPRHGRNRRITPFAAMAGALRGAALWGINQKKKPKKRGIPYAVLSFQTGDRPRI